MPTEEEVFAAGEEERAAQQAELDFGDEQLDADDPEQQSAGDDAAIAADEAEAGRKGWVPKDQYKGDPAKWVDAKTFVERGERFNQNLQREVAALKAKLESFEGTKTAFKKFHEETMAKKNDEIKEALQTLRLQKLQATREGEDESVLAIEDRMELLREQQKDLAKASLDADDDQAPLDAPVAGPDDPVLLEWIEDGNQWFDDDPKLRDYAIAIGTQLLKDGITVRGRKFLDQVSAKMAEEFPRKFKASRGSNNAAAVEASNGNNSAGVAGKSERDLPAEDLALMRQFIKEGWTTKEKFLASYFSR